MQILLGQINTTPGDFVGNYNKIISGLERVKETQVKLAIFPELSIPGYSCMDLMYQAEFIENNLKILEDIKSFTKNNDYMKEVYVIVGYIDRNNKGFGKPFCNKAALIKNGLIVGTYQKHLLPFYDVFIEGRFFEPGTELLTFTLEGKKFGLSICEDVWNDKDVDDYNYIDNPIESYRKLGVHNIINISSSPYVNGKMTKKLHMLSEVTKGFGLNKMSIVYVNQQGAQDDLVFDGNSCFIRDGMLVKIYPADFPVANLNADDYKETVSSYHILNTKDDANFISNATEISQLYKALVVGLRDYIKKSGITRVVLGSSGGIDSAVVAALAADAIGPENVHCIMMPSVFSSEGSVNDAKQLHINLGCKEYLVPIEHVETIKKLQEILNVGNGSVYNSVADENIQARIRGQVVMYFANAFNALALTTGNKTELATGYFTLYGDSNGGYAPINDLYKMQVYGIAKYINSIFGKEIIPKNIIDKAPSAELAPGQTDEKSLLPYPILDEIVKNYVENYVTNYEEFLKSIPKDNKYNSYVYQWSISDPNAKKEYDRIISLINRNEFKRRQTAIGTKVSKIAFGGGRRIPIVKK